ncbi:hypothetical protein AVEN_244366-1 [Araneus ventricosus]|uniref:Uncharacterized protein n=1 Tax=Araneus ventricosus TaxID=182803 RepID=A0A4Y2PNT9_ARAVE|nr:hypothetical protein AVEN_244366-1 [Araneus ventricosus]
MAADGNDIGMRYGADADGTGDDPSYASNGLYLMPIRENYDDEASVTHKRRDDKQQLAITGGGGSGSCLATLATVRRNASGGGGTAKRYLFSQL